MVTYPFQDDALWKMFMSVLNQLDLHIEKTREMTATWDLLICFVWFWQFHEGLNFRLVSRNADAVDNTEDPDSLFCKIDFILKHQPEWIINEDDYNRTYMHLFHRETKSSIDGSATTGDVGRSGRCTAMGMDEFAFVPNGYAMLRASRDVTNCRIYNSTPNGTGNAFYDLKRSKIQHLRLYWPSHPDKRKGLYRSIDGKVHIIDKEFHEVVQNSEGVNFIFPDNYPFRRDGKLRSPFYDRECDRASHPMEIAQELDIDYLGSDYQFFDARVIETIQAEDIREPLVEGELEFDYDSCNPIRFVESSGGRIKLWCNLTPEGNFPENIRIVQGGDVSAGTGASNSALTFCNQDTGEKLGEFVDPNMLAEDFALYAIALAKWLNNAFMIWDASGPHGRIFGGVVMDKGYLYIYWKANINRITAKPTEIPGFFMNPGDKADAFGKYRKALHDHTFIQRSYEANKETLFFTQVAGGKGIEHTASRSSQDPTGARESHGDRCTADVVTNYGLYHMRENKPEQPKEKEPEHCYKARRRAYEQKLKDEDEGWN